MSRLYDHIGTRKGETKEQRKERALHAAHYEGKHVGKKNKECPVCMNRKPNF